MTTKATRITALAININNMYVGGITSDDQLRTFTMTEATPFIMRYAKSGGAYVLQWARTINIVGEYIINGIGVDPTALFVVGHAFSLTYDSLIFAIRGGGTNNCFYTYPNS